MTVKYDVNVKYPPEFLRGSPPDELLALVAAARRTLHEMRTVASAGGRSKYVVRTHLFKKIRRDVARMKSVLNEGN